MPAYVLVEVEVTDPARYPEYARVAPATVAQYGGRYLARGGTLEPREGEWPPHRYVILEFPSVEAARRWYDSPEYAGPKSLRHKYARSRLAILEGLPQS